MSEKVNCFECGRPIEYEPAIHSYRASQMEWVYCPRCHKSAEEAYEKKFKKPKKERQWKKCYGCDGSGKIKGYTCQNCKGKKGHWEQPSLLFDKAAHYGPTFVKGKPI